MKVRLKSIIAYVTVFAVLLSILPFSVNTFAVSGSKYTANQYVAARLDLVLSEYPVGSYFSFDGKPCAHHNTNTCSYYGGCNCRSYFEDSETGKTIRLNSIQCMGFAHYVFYKLFGFVDRSEYDESKYYSLGKIEKGNFTAENCKNLLLNASTGAHIRVVGHSMIYLSGNNEGLTVLHCNADGKCGISIKYFTWADFAKTFESRGELTYVHMPKVYPGLSKTSVINTSKSYYFSGESVVFNWTSKSGVSDYKLKIRSLTDSSKSAEFSSIKGVTKTVTDSKLFVAGNTYVAEIYPGGVTKAESSVNFYIANKPSSVVGQTVKNGIYSLKNVKNGNYLTANSTVVTQSFNKNSSQKYYFEYIEDGLYKIHIDSLDNNKLLTVSGNSLGSVSSDSSLTVAEESIIKTNRQLFYIIPSGDGYQIESIGRTGYVINASSSNKVTINPMAQSSYKVFKFCNSSGTVLNPSKLSAFVVGNYQITTESTSLNVRNGPGTKYEIVGTVSKGEKVEVTAVDGEWGYISSPKKGWIMLENYATFLSPLVNSISVSSLPNKTTYSVGQSLETDGLKITVNYSDSTTKTITSGFVCSYDFSDAGDKANGYKKTVVVNYSGKTTTFDVIVTGGGMPSEIMSDVYAVNSEKKIISGISPGITYEEFIGGFYNTRYIKIYDGNNVVSGGTNISTGMTIKLTDGSKVAQQLTIVVTGDVNGDGYSDVSDILTIQSYILKKSKLNDTQLKSADCNGDGESDVSDILTIQSYILGKSSIKPQKF